MPLPLSRQLSTSTTTSAAADSPLNPAAVLRLCTVLYQQQRSPDSKLDSHLSKLPFFSSANHHHELFFQVCNRFPLSWRPVHRLHLFLLRRHSFSHSPATLSKLAAVLAASRNLPLLSSLLSRHRHLLTTQTLAAAAVSLAAADDISRSAAAIQTLNPVLATAGTLNLVVAGLCARRRPSAAAAVVSKLRSSIPADAATHSHLIAGFCKSGDLASAAGIWNKMLQHGLEPDVESYDELVLAFLKSNRARDAISLLKSAKRLALGDRNPPSYKPAIEWLCAKGRIFEAQVLFAEMLKRGVHIDARVLGALIHCLLSRRKVAEGYRVLELAGAPSVELYHGLMKGLLRLKRVGEATAIFREMVARGCEPTMHTYVMLLRGHMGRRGRKGRDPAVNFENIFVGGLVKAGKTVEAAKYVERAAVGGGRGVEVPRFDYNRFLHYFSNEEGVTMFEEVGTKLREVGMADLGDVLLRYGERMATRERRRRAMLESSETLNGTNM